jgi:hypothetical protein
MTSKHTKAGRRARTIAPHLRDDTPLALDHDALDELDTSAVRLRGVA